MGWSDGTLVFDALAEYFCSKEYEQDMYGPMSQRLRSPLQQVRHKVLSLLVEVLEDQDWDVPEESAYLHDPAVKEVFKELHPDIDWDEPDG